MFGLCLWLSFRAGELHAEALEGPQSGPARQLWLEGNQLWQTGDYAGAADRFDRAFELDRSPIVGLWVARSLARANRLVEALERYRELADQPLASDASSRDWSARRDAKLERQELVGRVPQVVVVVQGAPAAEVQVDLNGQPLSAGLLGAPRAVNPGLARARGAWGQRVAEASVELGEGETRALRLVFDAPPESPRLLPSDAALRARSRDERLEPHSGGSARRVLAYVALGVGGAALLTGGVFGALAASDQSSLFDACPGGHCPYRLRADVEAYESKKTIATVGLVSGAALIAGGVVLYFSLPASRPRPIGALGATLSARGVGVWGAF